MSKPHTFESIASAGDALARMIEQHMDRLFRSALEGAKGVTLEPRFVRVITGEATMIPERKETLRKVKKASGNPV